jgi:hypothetical protein
MKLAAAAPTAGFTVEPSILYEPYEVGAEPLAPTISDGMQAIAPSAGHTFSLWDKIGERWTLFESAVQFGRELEAEWPSRQRESADAWRVAALR